MFKIDENFMKLAIKKARTNVGKSDGGPFGACIATFKGEVLAVAKNNVLKSDATSHAEVNAIRIASKKLSSYILSDCVIYSTTEPCPMCFSAIHWSRIPVIVFGTSIKDAARIGFNEMAISNKRLNDIAKCKIDIYPGVLKDECEALFDDWKKEGSSLLY